MGRLRNEHRLPYRIMEGLAVIRPELRGQHLWNFLRQQS
jgi:hypothetical protein